MPRTALHDAKTAEEVRQAVHGFVNARDEDGRTALMVAAREGGERATGMMRLLVDAGADANKPVSYTHLTLPTICSV